ncbi:MAG: hypothetical protein CL394_10020 [Acidiferrobacteraceae bacterium]|nr:hypothetical protein [Acidiferrobacteraceae bacterium]
MNRFQAIQLKLAEMGTDLEAARQLVYFAAHCKESGLAHHKEAAMAKLFASEAAASICDKAARVAASSGIWQPLGHSCSAGGALGGGKGPHSLI